MKTIFSLCLFVISQGASAQVEVKVDYDESVKFSRYRTYRWISPGSLPLVRGVLSQAAPTDEEIDERIRTAIDKELETKGFRKQKESSLLVNYLGLVTFRSLDTPESRSSDASKAVAPYEHWKVLQDGVKEGYISREGTLTVDIVDAETNRLVWRGSVTEVVNEPVSETDKEALGKIIENAVKQLLRNFPPR